MDINLRVAHPAKALVALRTIGGQIQEVRALGPDDVFEQAVGHRIAAFKAAGQRRVAVQHNAGDGVLARLAGIAGDFDILKTVKGETAASIPRRAVSPRKM